MVNKKILVIAIVILIIVAVVAFIVLTTVHYEKIYITPNGTSIEVPANETKFDGKIDGAKLWNWNNGVLVTYNSYEDNGIIKVSELGFNALTKVIKNGQQEVIDGYTCYIINAEDVIQIHIFDIIKVNYNGKFYCIPLSNETTHDNIIICCNNKDVALHMAKSVEYKNVYLTNNNLNNTLSKVENLTGDLKDLANDYLNDVDLNNVDLNNVDLNNVNLNEIKSTIEDKAGDLLSKSPI